MAKWAIQPFQAGSLVLFRLLPSVQADYEETQSWEPRIVKTENVFAKPMSLEEAVLQMNTSKNTEFLVFSDASSGRVNVLYRRKDGDFGLVETEND